MIGWVALGVAAGALVLAALVLVFVIGAIRADIDNR